MWGMYRGGKKAVGPKQASCLETEGVKHGVDLLTGCSWSILTKLACSSSNSVGRTVHSSCRSWWTAVGWCTWSTGWLLFPFLITYKIILNAELSILILRLFLIMFSQTSSNEISSKTVKRTWTCYVADKIKATSQKPRTTVTLIMKICFNSRLKNRYNAW